MSPKSLLKKLIPPQLLSTYHRALASLAAFVYGNPSEKLIVVGVTGTNGKTTTVNLIARALEAGGAKVGLTSTVNFKIADKEWLNDKKMTMLGRFQLQKILKQMVDAGCEYAVIETSSLGIEQFRHIGINYDYAVFTKLSPEHIEAHGGFENYKRAKGKLFAHLTARPSKLVGAIPCGRPLSNELKIVGKVPKVSIVNADDQYADYFLSFKADKKFTFSIDKADSTARATDIVVSPRGTSFKVQGKEVRMRLIGKFNVYNALPAIMIARNEGIDFDKIKSALELVEVVPGRMERVDEGQDFSVLVDYCPEPASLGKLYETVNVFRKNQDIKVNRVIHVLGSCGGGRDVSRRPIMGELAGRNADIVIVTNEDPYDDDPQEIIDQVAAGAVSAGKIANKNLFKHLSRASAINLAITLAGPNDLVLVTGKGAEQAMAVANGKLIPWDDRAEIRKAIAIKLNAKS